MEDPDLFDLLNVYEEFCDDIQGIFRSGILMQILIALGSGEKTLADLRSITGSSSQALIPRIRQLESFHYVESKPGRYVLTPLGEIVVPEIGRLVRLMAGIRRHGDFWITHDVACIPEPFRKSLGALYDATVLHAVAEDILNVHTHFLQVLDQAEWIHAVSSITSHDHADTLRRLALRGTPIELVVPQTLAEKLMTSPYAYMRDDLVGVDTFAFYISPEPIRLGMTVTDTALSLGLYKRDRETYDLAADLTSCDRRAVSWGEQVFQYYKKGAEKLILE
jgi:predicted transcriptional regulator